MGDLSRVLLGDGGEAPRLVYGTVATSSPLTVTVPPSTVAVAASALNGATLPVGSKVAILQQGADRLVIGLSSGVAAKGIYTPTITGTGWVLGNGLVSGTYSRLGDIGSLNIAFTFGSSSTAGSGALSFSLPAGWTAEHNADIFGGRTQDNGGVIAPLFQVFSGTTVTPFVMGALNQVNNNGLKAAVPWAWAAGMTILIEVGAVRLA